LTWSGLPAIVKLPPDPPPSDPLDPEMFVPLLLSSVLLGTPDSVPLAAYPDPPGHPLANPAELGMGLSQLVRAEATLARRVDAGALPGAALAVGRHGKTVLERGFGHLTWSPGSPEIDPDHTVYDLASLTKVVATTTAVMLLVEDGSMSLDTPVAEYLPGFSGLAKDHVTVRHLLTHTSGLPAWADLWAETPEAALRNAIAAPLEVLPGVRVEYSDIGFIVLWAAAEAAAGQPLYRLLDTRVFGPLGMMSTTFLPGEQCGRCAPTGQRADGSYYRGVVHDPLSRRLGGISGNAGLFSTVHDLARFAAMLASGGEIDGVRVLDSTTVAEFSSRQPGAGTRALGWDTPDPFGGGAAGLQISPRAFGHTGFTGTSLWIDPDRGTWVVLLSNRTFEPRRSSSIQALRRTINDWVASSTADAAPR
jgi:CubicO group peptidase (beta-lactamase class C family)